jgi:hypothetical protein
LVGVGKLYLGKVIGESDDIIVVIKGNVSSTSRVISCGREDCAVFVFMFELEVLVEILFIDVIVVHDLEEFFKLFGEVIILSSRSLELFGEVIILSSRSLEF